jgi:hypothetical protein
MVLLPFLEALGRSSRWCSTVSDAIRRSLSVFSFVVVSSFPFAVFSFS